MTTTRKFLPTLLLLLASWTGQALADQAPQAQSVVYSVEVIVAAQNTDKVKIREPETPVRLAWQRVGSPLYEA